jgi:hypothetical protein
MTDNTISELVFKQLKAFPENEKCFDCGILFFYSISNMLLNRIISTIMGIN